MRYALCVMRCALSVTGYGAQMDSFSAFSDFSDFSAFSEVC